MVTEELVNDPMCMNLQLGGGGGFINKEHTLKCSYYGNLALSKKIKEDNNFREEWTKKLSIAWKKRFSDPSKEIPFRVTFEGMKHSEETKISISLKQKENQKGEKNSQFGSIWIYKEGTEKKIKNIQFPEFESNGWNKGRLKNKVL